ncbi:hypothetical protein CLCR_11020 [Cladophialophora carrionii]|uniref:Transmembrane protein n=1 Tax=Cladophialophora carrionii TaxID=86049 RepID=A0A1C1CXA2_9EURO|nr:hypothetical protein CLCR_11020 [Cladophialophora carrionii]
MHNLGKILELGVFSRTEASNSDRPAPLSSTAGRSIDFHEDAVPRETQPSPAPLPPFPKNDATRKKQDAKQNVVYLAIALVGGVLLVAKPALILFALMLMGYGKLHHVKSHEKSHGSSQEEQTEP